MSLKAEILALQERITWLDNMIRACQQSTGWEEAIKNAISRRDRWLDELKALTAEYTAATIAEIEARKAAMKARHEAAEHEAKKAAHKAMKAEHEAAKQQQQQQQQQRCIDKDV